VRFRRNLGSEAKKYEFKSLASKLTFDNTNRDNRDNRDDDKNEKIEKNEKNDKITSKVKVESKEPNNINSDINLSPEEKENYKRSNSHFKTVKFRSTKNLSLKSSGNKIICN